MSSKEEEFLLKETEAKKKAAAKFDAADGKILAFDLFRGPSTGITSELDLSNPASEYESEENLRK